MSQKIYKEEEDGVFYWKIARRNVSLPQEQPKKNVPVGLIA